jgi:hypothetical protein
VLVNSRTPLDAVYVSITVGFHSRLVIGDPALIEPAALA